jgi:hypothetical protein
MLYYILNFFEFVKLKYATIFDMQSIKIYINSIFVLVFYFQFMKKTYFVKTDVEAPKKYGKFF